METTEIARALRLVPNFYERCPRPAEQGIHETGLECFTQMFHSVVTNYYSRSLSYYYEGSYTHLLVDI